MSGICEIKIKLGSTEMTFHSDMELDQFLRDQAPKLGSWYKLSEDSLDKIFSTDFSFAENIDQAREKISEIQKVFNNAKKASVKVPSRKMKGKPLKQYLAEIRGQVVPDLGEIDDVQKLLNSISVTSFIETVGNRHNINAARVTAVNSDYEKYFRTKLEKQGVSENEINRQWEMEKWKGDLAAALGEDIHYILETKFRQIGDPSITLDINKFTVLTEEKFKSFEKTLDKIVSDIKARFPGAEFYPEFDIVSKHLPSNIKHAINQKQKALGKTSDISKINGRIDLLVIDKEGTAHIFDWKTSNKRVWKWNEMDNELLRENDAWTSTKKIKAFAQLGNYCAMLEQYGLEVGSAELVPVFVDFEKNGNELTGEVKDISLDESIDGSSSWSRIRAEMNHAEYNYGVTKPITLEKLVDVSNILNEMFPETNIHSTQVKHFEATASFYENDPNFLKPVKNGTQDYEDGFRWYFFKNNLPDKSRVRCKTKEEASKKIKEYVEELNNYMSNQMITFAEDLGNVLYTQGGKEQLDTWLSSFNERQANFLKDQFRKYYTNGWDLTINEELNNNGIFIFKKHDTIEIVALSEKDLHYIFNLNGNVNIAGNYKSDKAQGSDLINMLNSQFGNMVLMKVAAILATNSDIITDAKISNVKVINPWHCSITEAHSNKMFIHNWNVLATHYGKGLSLLSEKMFMNDAEACIKEAAELILSEDPELYGLFLKPQADQEFSDKERILILMDRMKYVYPATYKNLGTKEGYVYLQLQQALLHTQGIHVYEEPDRAGIGLMGISPGGLMVENVSQSKSTNVRALGKLFDQFREVYYTKYNDVAEEFIHLVEEVYKEWNYNRTTGHARSFWAQFFEHENDNENDPVDSRMVLKMPTHPLFKDKPKSRELINFILIELNSRRYPKEPFEELVDQEKYYEMPLLEEGLSRNIIENVKRSGIKGVYDGVWESMKNTAARMEEMFSGNADYQKSYTNKDKNAEIAFNRFLDISADERVSLINDPKKVWDFNIEAIFLNAVAADAVKQASERYGQYFVAFKAALSYLHQIGKNNIPEILEFVEKYVDNKVFLKKIRKESIDNLYNLIAVVKSVSSAMTLGFNTRSMSREWLVSTYTMWTHRATSKTQGISAENFADAMFYVAKTVPFNLTAQNMLNALNRRYGMTGYSYTEMAETNVRSHFGLQNMNSNDVYILSKLPDNYFRLTILVAKLMADGSFDAYDFDGENLFYDWKKDKRFTAFAENNKKDPTLYAEQKEVFKEMVKEWSRVRDDLGLSSISEIDNMTDDQLREVVLPDALPPSFKGSVRQMASELFGFFDTEDRSLISATLLGSAFMQYKTWLSAKLNQHLKQPGFVNIWNYIPVTDPDSGEPLYLVSASEEELANKMPPLRTVKKSEVKQEWLEEGRAIPWFVVEGTFQEGTVFAIGEFLSTVLTWDIDEFKRNWEDPMLRGQFISGLLDSFGMMVLIGIINAIFGEDVTNNMANQDWITQWSYGVLMGFAEDGPIHKVIGGMVGDLNPPSLIAIQKWAQTANSVLAGNKSVGQGLVESFGVTRELRGYFR